MRHPRHPRTLLKTHRGCPTGLVREFVCSAGQDCSLEKGVQRRAAAQQFGVFGAAGVRAPSCGSAVADGSLRATTRSPGGFTSYAVRWFGCRMIPCAELGGAHHHTRRWSWCRPGRSRRRGSRRCRSSCSTRRWSCCRRDRTHSRGR